MAKDTSLKMQIRDAVFKDIVSGIYKRNEILSEKQLTELYQVSKSPVREALIELCNDGVLLSHPRYGYEVLPVDERQVREIVSFRVMLETGCLRKAADYMTAKELDLLEKQTKEENEVDRARLSVFEDWENNTRFHLRLMQFSRNEYCYRMLEKSIRVLMRAYAQMKRDEWSARMPNFTDNEHHFKVIDLIRKGNIDQAELELKTDIEAFLAGAEYY